MSTPKITIGGVPIQQQSFSWSFTAGPEPYQTQLVVPNQLSQAIEGLSNPVEIKIQAQGAVGSTDLENVEYTIQNCWIVEPRQLDKAHVAWTLADNRFSYRGKIITCCYNKTRQKNSITSGVKAEIGTPSELRLDFDVFGAGRYISWSVHEDGTPYTMQEIINIELRKLGIKILKQPVDPQTYYLENIELNGVDVYGALRYLCNMARYDISITNTGEIYAYNVDFYDQALFRQLFEKQENRAVTRGRIYFQDRKKIRPKEITIYFEKKQEIWLTNSSSEGIGEGEYLPVRPSKLWTDIDIANKSVVGCENVIRIPYPTTIAGKEYKVGEWVPMWRYLKAIDLSEAEIRDYWFSNALETVYVEKQHAKVGTRDKNNEVIWRQIIVAVRQHYRQTFQIDPLFMDTIENWDARRVGIVDNYSHFSPPSPVFTEYTIIPKARQPAVAKRIAGWADQAYVWDPDVHDPSRQRPTPATIETISQPMGIFRISYPSVMFSALHDIIPFGIETVPIQGVSQSVLAFQSFLIRSAKLKSKYKMETIISVVKSIDSAFEEFSPRKYYPVIFSNVGGDGPPIFHLSKTEYARYAVKEISGSGLPVSKIGDVNTPMNDDIIKHIARTEASRILFNYLDFPMGAIELSGVIEVPLQGNLFSITINFSPIHGLTSTFTFKPTPGFSLEQRLNQDVVNFLHKHVTRGEEQNLAGGRGF